MKNKLMEKIIESGKICSVTFVKKDGSLRTLVGRTGVSKHVKGGARTSDNSQYIMFWDKNEGRVGNGYRNINRDTIVAVKGLGVTVTREGI